MAVLWLILKGIGWILLAIVALLIAALLVPVTAELCYEQGRFTAALRVLAVRVRLYPRPEKKAAPQKPEKAKRPNPKTKISEPVRSSSKATGAQQVRQEVPQPEKNASEAAARQTLPQTGNSDVQPPKQKANTPTGTKPKPAAKPAPEKTLGETLDWVLHWANTGGAILRRFLAGFKIHHIRIYLPVRRDSAAATAFAVGAVHAGLGASFGALQNFFDLRMEQLVIEPDYTGEHQGQEHFSCKITSHLIIMVITGIWALIRLKQEKLL